MYAPSDASNEWFELHNTGSNPLDIQNWKWKDATASIRNITGLNINIPSNGFLVVCQDSTKLKNQFPLLTGIFIQTAWSQLNNSGDNLILIDASNTRVDSVVYSSGWGGSTGGNSLERIDPAGPSNLFSNWGSSIDFLLSTPNRQNSITPKSFDLYLKTFSISPIFPSSGETLQMDFIIRNSGLNAAANFLLNIYNDTNKDSVGQSEEIINSQSFQSLISFDSISYNFTIQNIDTGLKQFIAKVIYANDNDTLNNEIVKRVFVSSISGGGGLVINEIMYDPLSNQSEWLEIYNASGQTINIKGWKYKEANSSITLSSEDLNLIPGDYFILAHDTTIFLSYDYLRAAQSNQIIKFSASLSLSNSGESISITDSLNNLIDAVHYLPEWHNSNLTDAKGISLERINPGFKSSDRNNWSSCADISGGTPGLQNSIFLKNISSNSNITISPNPFSPDGDGHEDFALIKYKLSIPMGQMRVKVFDIKGRMVRTLSNNQITGNEGTIIFNGMGDDNQRLRIGIYILFIEAIDDKGGVIDIVKAPVVVAAKL